MQPLAESLEGVASAIRPCRRCGNLDDQETCAICRDPRRDTGTVCVVETVADLWALERAAAYKGLYHVLGGTLSALDGVGPDDLAIAALVERLREGTVKELILALAATVDGQTTAHYVLDRVADIGGLKTSQLAHGVPVGGELDYLDDGTIAAALGARRDI